MATETTAGFLDEALKHLADNRPLLPMYLHLILSALFPIYTGAHASLSRPASAAEPPKKDKTRSDTAQEDGDDEETIQKMEGLSPQDAIIFPITAGLVLGGLYFLIKYYGADVINFVLGWYFSVVGVFSVAKLVNDGIGFLSQLVFPRHFNYKGRVWKASEGDRKMNALDGSETTDMASPQTPTPLLPWLNGRGAKGAWGIRAVVKRKFAFEAYARTLFDISAKITLLNILATAISIALIAYSNLVSCPWWLTNIQGFAVSYSALQYMSPTSFTTGTLILIGLFFYDIWAVFFTPLMVSVATNLEQPIKLVFPRPDEPGVDGEPPVKNYSMLGLGDIVLPGIVIGLALRFDLHLFYLKQQQRRGKSLRSSEINGSTASEVEKPLYISATSRWGDRLWTWSAKSPLPEVEAARFPKPYFNASLVGYVLGMLTTLAVMSIFQHAQPALLYLVPGVLISLWTTAIARGEVKEMWAFSEGLEEELEDEKKKEESKNIKVGDAEVGSFGRFWKLFSQGDKTVNKDAKNTLESKKLSGEARSEGTTKTNDAGEKKEKEDEDENDDKVGLWLYVSIRDVDFKPKSTKGRRDSPTAPYPSLE
ncbi:hypothetical protein K431DRAFT_286735 [Polychaeton citri CBS 116435]|uniref:Signal peptide peptidase n=1 Tax=Polychaeton citri CBS 116435 TaxID=1314669 RepID=A0A9P4UKV1_9PEZI|nr:hypothetical protein K431DRAFT_286735 [Polychaeton citri CBS 116435]